MNTSEKNFNVFRITTAPFRPELVSGVLWELELDGITEEENFMLVYSSEEKKVTKEKIELILNGLIEEEIIQNYSIEQETLENKNWNEIWEKGREVFHVSDTIVIRPTFKEYTPKPGELVLAIDPKMSFGTGEHQTTQLVLQSLEKYVKPEMKVLDVGSGTGILAIAAIKFGAASAVAIDNDEWCYDNCKENVELNDVKDKMETLTCNITDISEKDFDLILANIQKNILLELAGEIKKKIRQNGILILSGLLKKDEEQIIKSYSGLGFTFLEKTVKDEWISLVFIFKSQTKPD